MKTTLISFLTLAWLILLAPFCYSQGAPVTADSSRKTMEPSDYFNTAGKQYVKEQKIDALRTLDKGLKAYPGDPRLLKFAEELIKEEQNKQQQQMQQQQQKQEEERSKKEEQKGQEQKQEEAKKDEKQSEKSEPSKEREAGKPEPGRISEKDAERILDAMDREEKTVQRKVRDKQRTGQRSPIDKDW